MRRLKQREAQHAAASDVARSVLPGMSGTSGIPGGPGLPHEMAAAPAAGDGPPRRPRGRRRGYRAGSRRMAAAMVPLAVLASGAMVYQASNAAFTARTETGANNWAAGTVDITNSASGVVFNASNLTPSFADKGTRCIDVTYGGSLAAAVKLYVKSGSYANTNNGGGAVGDGNFLGSYLRVTVEEGDDDCAGTPNWTFLVGTDATTGATLNAFQTANTQWSNGVSSWTPAGGSNALRAYRVSWWLPDLGEANAPATQAILDALQGDTTTAVLTWEARNT